MNVLLYIFKYYRINDQVLRETCSSLISLTRQRSGAVLLGLVVFMLIFSALAVAMLFQTSAGELSYVNENKFSRAYFLAESGYRYAEAKLKAGINPDILHDHGEYFIGSDGSFKVEFKPYIFDVVGGTGTDELETKIPFGVIPDIDDISGYIKIGDESREEISGISTQSTDTVIFTKDSGSWDDLAGKRVKLVVLSNGDAVSEGGDLNLQPGSSGELFPPYNGNFVVDDKTYSYRKSEEDKLIGIERVDSSTWEAPSLAADTEIVLEGFTELHSTGDFAEANRKVTYHIPIKSSDKGEIIDKFEDLSRWEDSTSGTHEIGEIDSDKALKVTAVETIDTDEKKSLIELKWSETNVDIDRSYFLAGDFLSYDTQIKIGFDPSLPDAFMTGISFRLDSDNNETYGISIIKGENATDGIPDEFVPDDNNDGTGTRRQGELFLVLWQQTNSGADKTWLTYKELKGPSFSDNIETPWEADDQWDEQIIWEQVTLNWLTTSIGCCSGNCYNPTIPATGFSYTISSSMNLEGLSSVSLEFCHTFVYDYVLGDGLATVYFSKDGGSFTQIESYTESIGPENRIIGIPSEYSGESDFKLAYLLNKVSASTDNWNIDDIKITSGFPIDVFDELTLMVRVEEAAATKFTSGELEPQIGDTVKQEVTPGVFAEGVVRRIIITSGAWADSDAEGYILLNELPREVDGSISVSFTVGGELKVSGSKIADIAEFREKDNYVRAFVGETNGYGTANADSMDYKKDANDRGDINWPPDDIDDWAVPDDYFSLIQWDAVNTSVPSSVSFISPLTREKTIIQTSDLVTPNLGDFTRSEIGLHTYGDGSYSTNVYFDDFGFQTTVPTSIEFLPAVEE